MFLYFGKIKIGCQRDSPRNPFTRLTRLKLVLVSPMAKGGKVSEMRFSSVPPCLAKGLEKSGVRHKLFAIVFRKACACQDPFLLFRLKCSGDSPAGGINAARERDMEMEHAEHD